MQRMKILITTDWYKPAVNGVVTSVENLAKGLRMAGHEVRIVTLSGSFRSWSEDDVYYVASINMGIVYEKARLKWIVPKSMMRDILEWKPDIVHSQCEFSTFRITREVAYACNIPLVHTYHTVYENYTHYFCFNHKMGKKVAAVLSRNILSETDAVIVPSSKIQTMLLQYKVEQPIYTIPSGIDLEQYMQDKESVRESLRASLGIKADETVLLSIGRLAKEKNLEEILYYLQKADEKQKMLIVGDGPIRSELERLAKELGIEGQLIFTGMIPPTQIPDYYAAGDIFVSASRSETQGLTYMEAMASALPMLCRADECLKGVIVNGENGFLYHTESEFLNELCRLNHDFILRKSLGMMARQSIQSTYSIKAFTDSCMDVYHKAILRKRYAYDCKKAV